MGYTLQSFEVLPFYRGVSARIPRDSISIHRTRKDRVPRNTSQEIHEAADLWFEKRFGVRYRSQALFVTSFDYIASAYADGHNHVVRIIPLGAYRYCWSPAVADMLMLSVGESNPGKFVDILEKSDYRETGLLEAHNSGNEVMLFCDRYISVPISFIKENGFVDGCNSKSGIIIPKL